MPTVVLDPGHGGGDSGGYGHGMQEKHLVLDIALKAASKLRRAGIDVHLTRTTDTYITITARHMIATRLNADLFISIHCDAVNNPGPHGFEILWFKEQDKNTIGEMVKAEMLTVHNAWNRWIYGDYVGVLVHATMPALLTENLYVSNPHDAQLLASPDFRDKIAQAHANAIIKYFHMPIGEEEEMGIAVIPLERVEAQGNKKVWVTPEGFTRNPMFGHVECWLNIYNESAGQDIVVEIYNSPANQAGKFTRKVNLWERLSINMRELMGEHDGFATIVKCRQEIVPTLTIMAR